MRTELDIIAERQFAVEQAEARAEARGEAKQQAKTAKAMLAKNLDVSLIAACTGLKIEEVEALRQN